MERSDGKLTQIILFHCTNLWTIKSCENLSNLR